MPTHNTIVLAYKLNIMNVNIIILHVYLNTEVPSHALSTEPTRKLNKEKFPPGHPGDPHSY